MLLNYLLCIISKYFSHDQCLTVHYTDFFKGVLFLEEESHCLFFSVFLNVDKRLGQLNLNSTEKNAANDVYATHFFDSFQEMSNCLSLINHQVD